MRSSLKVLVKAIAFFFLRNFGAIAVFFRQFLSDSCNSWPHHSPVTLQALTHNTTRPRIGLIQAQTAII